MMTINKALQMHYELCLVMTDKPLKKHKTSIFFLTLLWGNHFETRMTLIFHLDVELNEVFVDFDKDARVPHACSSYNG